MSLVFYQNPRVQTDADPAALCEWLGSRMFSSADCEEARETIEDWPGYEPTRLVELPEAARAADVAAVFYKDESDRFGLKSFKALGGAYAVYRLLSREVVRATGAAAVSTGDLAGGQYRQIAETFTVATATAGNHGRSVAWGARMFGCPCFIYVHSGVSDARAAAIAAYGATIVRVDGDYDDSVRAAARDAEANGWNLVSDTSYPGYEEIPALVMLGYTVMLGEVMDQLDGGPPTHVIVQAGVGGLAAAVAAFFALRCGAERPRIIIVEAEKADCLYQSAVHGERRLATGGLGSVMLGLDAGEVSLLAWDVLDRLASVFVLISDEAGIEAMRQLTRMAVDGGPIVAGECAGAGLAVLNAVAAEPGLGQALELNHDSRVLLIGSEGATDPATRERLLRSGEVIA